MTRRSLWIAIAALLCAVAAWRLSRPADGAWESFDVRVVDGDTLEVGGVKVRLFGVDAPEAAQTCWSAADTPYRCGDDARAALAGLVQDGPVRCTPRDQDRYGRTIAICTVGGEDIGAALVRRGWALAYVQYADAYVADEATAAAGHLGLWQGRFDRPWDHRRNAASRDKEPQGAPR